MHNYYGQNEEIVVVEDEYGKRDYKESSENVEGKLKQENKIEELERQRNLLLKFLQTRPSIEEMWRRRKKQVVCIAIVILGLGELIAYFIVHSPLSLSGEALDWVPLLVGSGTAFTEVFAAQVQMAGFKDYKEEIIGKKAKVYYLDEQLKVEYEKQKELGKLKSVVPEKEIILEPTRKINNEPMIGQIRKNLEEWRRFFFKQRGTKETYQIYTEFQEEILKRERTKNKAG